MHRIEAAKQLTSEGMSQHEAADILGVNQSTITRDLGDANASDDTSQPAEIDISESVVDANASAGSARRRCASSWRSSAWANHVIMDYEGLNRPRNHLTSFSVVRPFARDGASAAAV